MGTRTEFSFRGYTVTGQINGQGQVVLGNIFAGGAYSARDNGDQALQGSIGFLSVRGTYQAETQTFSGAAGSGFNLGVGQYGSATGFAGVGADARGVFIQGALTLAAPAANIPFTQNPPIFADGQITPGASSTVLPGVRVGAQLYLYEWGQSPDRGWTITPSPSELREFDSTLSARQALEQDAAQAAAIYAASGRAGGAPDNSYGYGNPNEASEYSSQNETESLNDAWAPGGSDLYGYGNPNETPTNFGGTTDSDTNGWGMIDPGMGTWGGDKDTSLADLGDNGKLGDTGTAPTKFSSLNDTLFDTGSNYDNGAATEAGFYGVGGYGGNNEMETQNAVYNEGGSDLYGYGNTDAGAARLLTGRHARRGRVVRPTGVARETSNRTAKVTHLIARQALTADFITPMGSLIIRRSRRNKFEPSMSPPSVPHAVYRHLRTAVGMVL
ncbi:MAG: hypothetical protein HOO99_06505 [Hyphomicrobiaceae bacterium]|nr:hypothetical protein [Hyphomicrobiaceae bacterium]